MPAPATTLPDDAAVPLVIWGETVSAKDAVQRSQAALGLQSGQHHAAGGRARPSDDAATLETLRATDSAAVAIVSRGWEPPLLEQLDFAEQLAGAERGPQVLILALRGEQPLNASQRQAWEDAVARLDHPRVGVEFEA